MKLSYLYYKEPMREVEGGFGYLGALGQTDDGELVQCHICGELCASLGSHAFQKHGLKANEYRDKFQLAKRTPLCSDKFSETGKIRWLNWYNNLSEAKKKEHHQAIMAAQKIADRKPRTLTLEEKNRKGICPDQLMEKIQTCALMLGKTPTLKEFEIHYDSQRFTVPIIRTFGSWSKALEFAQLTPNPIKTGGKMPSYTKEQLLKFLTDYYQMKGVPPTATDALRGYIPTLQTYIKHFGGIRKARALAGLPEYVATRV